MKIDATGQIFVKERPTDIRAVRANIESGLAVKPDASVVVGSIAGSGCGIARTRRRPGQGCRRRSRIARRTG